MSMSQDDIKALELELAGSFYEAVQHWSNQTERSLQEQDKVIGVSNIGHCSEYVRRLLINEEPSQEPDKYAAFLGTWIGAGIEQAIAVKYPEAIIQSEITITLETDQGTFTITGHPDIVFAVMGEQGIVVDCKTVNQLSTVTSYGVFENNLQKRFQRHLYAKGCHDAGMFGDKPLEDILVGNLWADRSGQDKEFHVRLEPYSEQVVDHARDWLAGVVYAYKNNIEAAREPQRTFCENWCEFFGPCRGADTDVEGLITDPRHLRAIDLYKEGGALESAGKKMKSQARTELEGVSGSTGQWVVREVEVGPTSIPASTRRGYTRLSITKAK